MGRFSPTVAPTWGQSFGHALEGGVDAFLQARRQKMGQEEQMLGRGYRPLTDADLTPDAETQAASVPGAVIPQGAPTLAGPDAAQALAGGPPPTFKGRPKAGAPAVDPALLAAALSNHVQSGRPLQAPSAPSPQQIGAQLPRQTPLEMGGRKWMRTDEGLAAQRQATEDHQFGRATKLAELAKSGYVEDGQGGFRYDPNSPAAQRDALGLALTRSEIDRNSRPPVTPQQHIDPLSPAGIAAQRSLKAYEASLRPAAVDADGNPVVKGGKPSDGQIQAGMFATRMASAEKLLQEHEREGTPTTGLAALAGVPVIGNFLRNTESTPEQQMYRQAQEDWVRAKLRKESGAAIGRDEMEQEIATYFKQAGDSDEVVAQKARRRQEATELLRASSGAGARLFGNPPGASPHHAGPVIGASGSQVLNQAPKSAGVPHGDTGNVDLRLPATQSDPILDKYGLTPRGH